MPYTLIYYYILGYVYDVDEKLQIGFVTQQSVKTLLNNGDISVTQRVKFFDGVRCFFEKAVENSLKKLPLHDELLKAATFVNFEHRESADILHAEYFVNRLIFATV